MASERIITTIFICYLILWCVEGQTFTVSFEGDENVEHPKVVVETGETTDSPPTWSKSESIDSGHNPSPEWDEFGGDIVDFLDQDADPSSWQVPHNMPARDVKIEVEKGSLEAKFQLGIKLLFGTPSFPKNVTHARETLLEAAKAGNPNAQSAVGFLYLSGHGVSINFPKGFLYHSLAASAGNFHSLMVLAYQYLRQQEFNKAIEIYSRVAAKTVATNHIFRVTPLVDPVKLNSGSEENMYAVRGHGGEDDETIQFVKYKAWIGNVDELRALGYWYFWGSRGLKQDVEAAFGKYKRAADQKDPMAMAAVGEMYTFGLGVQHDYEKAKKLLMEAQNLAKEKDDEQASVAAIRGLAYLHARGFGFPRNYTKALAMFKKAALYNDVDSRYYLGVMYSKGLGADKNFKVALQYFALASAGGHLAAAYQQAKMLEKGLGVEKNIHAASILYKSVAESGPWGTFLSWAHKQYLEKDLEQSYLLYARAAEMGYQVAQSNAAWLLDKFPSQSGCLGSSGDLCSVGERHQRANRLWTLASEQGDVEAALLVGDAYYYGKGMVKDLVRAAEAYRRASDKENAQAMFNLGFMYEHGEGLPKDFPLAKRFYDMALKTDSSAALAVKLALIGLWWRQRFPTSFIVGLIDYFRNLLPLLAKDSSSPTTEDLSFLIGSFLALCAAFLVHKLFINRQRQNQGQQN